MEIPSITKGRAGERGRGSAFEDRELRVFSGPFALLDLQIPIFESSLFLSLLTCVSRAAPSCRPSFIYWPAPAEAGVSRLRLVYFAHQSFIRYIHQLHRSCCLCPPLPFSVKMGCIQGEETVLY